ncbi:MAG: LicD family protein [Tannerellaceae bacterium]|jgi:lipopolysaccharide cholinephosphotransferase|nr:LicD family protein [Tannerellaceae bacterium]
MKHIDIQECHDVLLALAQEFDRICRKHQIPYYMLGGTMLGAIRHQGFIPWDDDMDFGVPIAYIDRLRRVLSEELPPHFRILSRKCEERILPVFKIDDARTFFINTDTPQAEASDTGLSIDIFPLYDGWRTSFQTHLVASFIFFLIRLRNTLYYAPSFRKGWKKQLARLCRFLLPINLDRLLKYTDRCIRKYTIPHSGFFINYYGMWRKKEMVGKAVFGTPTEYTFTGVAFYGVEQPDAYLRRLYGNYMQMPPEAERVGHVSNYYKR